VEHVRRRWGVAERRACRFLGFARSSARYEVRRERHQALRDRLRELAEEWPRYGYRRLHLQLQRSGEVVSRKLVWRLYREEGLKLRPHRKGQPHVARSAPLRPPVAPGERWAMDFVHDSLRGGRPLRILSILDEGGRECVGLEVALSVGATRVVAVLEQLVQAGHKPRTIVLDNGPEFRSRLVLGWAKRAGVELAFTEPGRPTQNAFVESFHAHFRDECLNLHLFTSLVEARHEIEAWRQFYNTRRPHSSLGDLTPSEYKAALNPAA
jgi:putative transposase